MKRPALLILIFLCVFSAGAQVNRFDSLFLKNGSIGVEAGIAVPVLDYGSTEYKRASGFANPGIMYKFQAGYEFLPYLGFKINYLSINNSVDAGALRNGLQNTFGSRGIIFHSVESDPFKMSGVMAGLYYPMRLFKATFEVRALAGFMNSYLPANIITLYDPVLNADRTDRTREANSSDAAYSAGFGARYKLYGNLLLTGSVDFFYSEQHFDNVQTYISTATQTFFLQSSYTQYYHILQFGAGLALQFN